MRYHFQTVDVNFLIGVSSMESYTLSLNLDIFNSGAKHLAVLGCPQSFLYLFLVTNFFEGGIHTVGQQQGLTFKSMQLRL